MLPLGNTAAPAAVGHPGLDKGAKTRFNNDRIKAKKSNLTASAANALKYKRSGTEQPTGKQPLNTLLPFFKKPNVQRVNQAVQGPQEPLMQQEQPPPMIDPMAEVQAQIDLNELFDSPEFYDSMTKTHLVDYFKGREYNPEAFAMDALRNIAR